MTYAETGAFVASHTNPEELVLFSQDDLSSSNPIWLGASRRYGYNINTDALNNARLDSVLLKGANTLVLLSPSTQLHTELLSRLKLLHEMTDPKGAPVKLYEILPLSNPNK
jgi:hypothetical protein